MGMERQQCTVNTTVLYTLHVLCHVFPTLTKVKIEHCFQNKQSKKTTNNKTKKLQLKVARFQANS